MKCPRTNEDKNKLQSYLDFTLGYWQVTNWKFIVNEIIVGQVQEDIVIKGRLETMSNATEVKPSYVET